MNTKNLKIDTSTNDKDLTTLNIVVDNSAYEEELNKQIEYYKPRVNIKGFRKGHAPNNVVLSRYKDALLAATNEALIEESWNAMNEEKNIQAIGVPKLINMDKKDDGLYLTYEYYECPNITLPDLSSISVEKNKYIVDDSVVDAAYKLSLNRFAQFVESDLKSDKGDRVSVKIDFSEDDYKKYNKEFTVVASDGEGDTIFAKNAIEVKKGDKKLLETFVDDKKTSLTMEIIKVEKPDNKDDSKEEDRKSVMDSLKEHLIKRAEDRANSELVNKTLFDKFVELVKVDVPKGYYEEEFERTLEEYEKNIASHGMTKTEFLLSVGKTDEEVKKDYSESLRKQIIFDLIMTKMGETYKDSIVINEEKAKNYANQMYQYQQYMGLSKRPKEEQQKVINYIMRDAQSRATSEAILDYVKEHVKITEKDAGKFEANENDIWAGY